MVMKPFRQLKGLCGVSGKEVERVMTVMAADNTSASYQRAFWRLPFAQLGLCGD